MATHPLIEVLKQPWSATALTPDQEQRGADVASAKELWNKVMQDFRARKDEITKDLLEKDNGNNENETRHVEQPFCFMDLPGEIRDMIYDFSIQDDAVMRQRRVREESFRRCLLNRSFGSPSWYHIRQHTARARKQEDIEYTREQLDRKNELRKLRKAKKENGLTDGCCEAFERQIFHDTFYLYYSRKREGLWFTWTVKNLDFFHFLRFWQSLMTRGDHSVEIKPEEVHLKFVDENEMKDIVLHDRKFENVKRLVELHWLEGFPLWGRLTGCTDFEDDRGPFFDWMYSVRQIVALYRVNRETWKSHSIKHLRKCEDLDDDESLETNFPALADVELVEKIIDMLCYAIEYNLGYRGNYTLLGRDGKECDKDVFKVFWYKRNHRKIALEREHAFVHHVRQYRNKIDKELRDLLGETYGEWERLADDMSYTELFPAWIL
ncbi:hypothetical protein PtrV1_09726 [Pyrenophora tritici-repentis]|uniref:Uncharacterized protein n=1 Tax=Pyrenophora tritici-repentis TaxID=45151 RepID=A0A317B7Z6_9PLEO|nr:hypothetical protein PtrV1_09726 [Pyrenophora tritici-repentis]KAF7442819.1 hypothetical protein A1F99_123260 [Pyrenophora tritici-repentis]KAF7568725.1 hypothetical protein PtrM4_133380 [Pyrenophora tritici-repentis]KAI1597555.1 hypothetical protein PtrCC142_008817 [Pyrenophora tritici-repentis]PWO24788.1 MelB, Na+melibiose symporter [Pyrenophora tritici-repentis]